MTKQSIFGRISTLVRANINALLDSAEDPQKMLDQLVRDYTNSIADAESAIAETIGNLRLLERDHEEDVQAATEWGNKALAASRKADEMRGAGNTADADKFDNLAKIALQRQISAEREATGAEPQIAAQTEIVDKLKSGLNGMKDKLNELKNKRSELLARAKVAEAQTKVQDAVSSINVLDPTSELGRFEDKVRRQEAIAQGKAELAASSLDALPGGTDDLAVVWCDAHADLHTPDTSPSGAFSGMALRAVLGEGEARLALSPGVPRERVVTVGVRTVDDTETDELDRLRNLGVNDVEDTAALAGAVEATGATRVWVHIDVDVLDPASFSGVSSPVPFGTTPAALSAAIRELRSRVPLAGATVAGFAPRTPADAVDDLGALLRLVGAVA